MTNWEKISATHRSNIPNIKEFLVITEKKERKNERREGRREAGREEGRQGGREKGRKEGRKDNPIGKWASNTNRQSEEKHEQLLNIRRDVQLHL